MNISQKDIPLRLNPVGHKPRQGRPLKNSDWTHAARRKRFVLEAAGEQGKIMGE